MLPYHHRTWAEAGLTGGTARSGEHPKVSGSLGESLAAGGVRGVDQGTERACGLPRPHGARVRLRSVLKIPEKMLVMPIRHYSPYASRVLSASHVNRDRARNWASTGSIR
jgi:hypothetical protein